MALPVTQLYPKGVYDLFAGEQLVVVGRYRKSGAAKVTVKGTVSGQIQQYDFPANFISKSSDESNGFVEKLWATRRIGEIIDELDLNGKNEELVHELIELSIKHGILTPYTSFLADDRAKPLASVENRQRTQMSLSRLSESVGKAGVAQRSAKGKFQNATSAPATLGTHVVLDIDGDREVAASNVRQAGNRAYYSRKDVKGSSEGKTLLMTPETAELDLEMDKKNIEIVDRFSEKYFELVSANNAAENQIFAQQQAGEELLVKLRGKNYLVK